jgi:hypothetical protein
VGSIPTGVILAQLSNVIYMILFINFVLENVELATVSRGHPSRGAPVLANVVECFAGHPPFEEEKEKTLYEENRREDWTDEHAEV